MSSRAELTIKVLAFFWRTADGWAGECLQLDARGVGLTIEAASNALLTECHEVARRDLEAGRFPDKHTGLDSSIVERLTALREAGAPVSLTDLYRGDAEHLQHVAVHFDVRTQLDVPNLQGLPDVGLLRFVFVRDQGMWVVQCLEYDLGGEGKTKREAFSAFCRALVAQASINEVLGRAPLAGLARAPRRFWNMYRRGEPISLDKLEDDVRGEFRVAKAA